MGGISKHYVFTTQDGLYLDKEIVTRLRNHLTYHADGFLTPGSVGHRFFNDRLRTLSEDVTISWRKRVLLMWDLGKKTIGGDLSKRLKLQEFRVRKGRKLRGASAFKKIASHHRAFRPLKPLAEPNQTITQILRNARIPETRPIPTTAPVNVEDMRWIVPDEPPTPDMDGLMGWGEAHNAPVPTGPIGAFNFHPPAPRNPFLTARQREDRLRTATGRTHRNIPPR